MAVTATLGAVGLFQLKLARDGDGWLIAGQSLAGNAHTERLLDAWITALGIEANSYA